MNTPRKFNVQISLCLVMIGLISVAEATVPPIPKGIVSMPPPGSNYPDEILNDSRIMGLDVTDKWGDVEGTEGVYDWSSIDTQLAQAEAHGKKVIFGIVSGGVNVPDWLLANHPDIQTFTFIDPNTYSPTFGQQLTIPVFWDPIFLAKKIAFIQATGARYAANPNIVVVGCSFANALSIDWNIPHAPEDIANWLAAGYTSELVVNTGEMIIDATMAAFPNQNVVLPIGLGAPGLDPTVTYLAKTVVDYATTTYGRFITVKDSLAAFTPDPSTVVFDWLVLFNQCPNVAGQMLWNVSGDETYRMNGGIPGDKETILLDAVTIGAQYGMQYQEIYLMDLLDPDMSPVISYANYLLTVTPGGEPPPVAPTNLNATASNFSSANLTWADNANNELGYRIESKIGATGTYGLVTTEGPNTTAATINNLIEGTQYYYRLQAVNAGGRSAYSNETSAVTVLTSPGSLTAQALSSSQVLLSWTDRSATETGFKIERSPVTDTNFTEIATVGANTTSFTDSGLNEATTYWYRVRAYNADTISDYSSEKQVTTLYNIPAAPSGLTITVLPNKVTLSWSDNSGDEAGFKIQRKTGVTGTYADLATTAANATGYTDNAVTDGTLYYYRVCATNPAGDSAFSNETSGMTPLKAPTSATATAVSSSQINLTWIDNSASETGYKIERKTTVNGTYAQIAQVGANVQSYSDSNGLTSNTRYYYRARATNVTIDSGYSNEPSALTFQVTPAPPSGLTITSVLSNQVSLSWSDNSNNEAGFKIQRKTGTTGAYVDITTTGANVTAYNDRDIGLRDGTVYYYRVSATNATGDSAFSNEASGTTPLAKPTSATATAVSSSQINLTWVDNSASETRYKIERKRTSTGTYAEIAQVGANVQSYSDSNGLDFNTTYFYRIRATNGTIDSDYSNTPSATTLLDTPAPPSGLTITSVLSNRVNLSWVDNSNNETGFKIQRKTGATGTYVTIVTTGPNVTAYNDSTVTDGTVYYYRVSATNATGDSAFSNEASGTTPLAKPTSATATAVSSSQINLTWVDNSASETRYKIERKRTSTGTYAEIAQVGANVQSYSDSNGLDFNTTYFYRIRATNGTIDSDYSNTPSATTLLDTPAPPSGLTITSVLSNRVNLSWVDNSNNETGFKIQRKTGATGTYVTIVTTGPNVTAYNDSTVTDGTVYYYRVSATNATGDSAFSNEASGTTPLAKPTSATATAVSSSQINLTWIDNSASETGYKIERKTTVTGSYAQIDQVGANVQSYSDTNGLAPNTKYYYRLRAANGPINSDYSNEPSAVTFQVTPTAPSGLTITSLLSNRVSLSWIDNSNNETGFKIQRKTGVTGTYATIATPGPNVTAYNDSTVTDGTVYYYQVSATNTAGDSAFSNEASGTTPLAKPTSATATAVSSSQINLTWVDNSASETRYKIERKRTSTGTYAEIGQMGANVQSYSDGGLDPNTRYFYRVRATNGTIDSDYSNETSAVTLP